MSKLLPVVIFLVAAIAGGAGGYFAKQTFVGGAAHADGAHDADDHGDADAKKTAGKDKAKDHGAKKADAGHAGKDGAHKRKAGGGHKKKAGGGHGGKKGGSKGGGELSADGFNYFKFSREFIVPIVGDEGVRALVLLDLNLEVTAQSTEAFYVREAKLRDTLMQELLSLANEGRFDGRLTDRRNLDAVRRDLLRAVREITGDDVSEVLILDIMRQDVGAAI